MVRTPNSSAVKGKQRYLAALRGSRKFYGMTVAEFLTIQPMQAPVQRAMYLDFVHEPQGAPFDLGSAMPDQIMSILKNRHRPAQ